MYLKCLATYHGWVWSETSQRWDVYTGEKNTPLVPRYNTFWLFFVFSSHFFFERDILRIYKCVRYIYSTANLG